MEQENVGIEREKQALLRLLNLEDMAVKKAKIYAKLLTEQSLARDMENLAERHSIRKEKLERLLYGEKATNKKNKDGETE